MPATSDELIFYHFGAAAGMPDVSPFCVKLETWLRLSQIPYVNRIGNPLKAPYGKLPYVKHRGELMADSDRIIKALEADGLSSLDRELSPQQRAQARAWQSMLEEHLYFAIVRERWQDDAGWAIYSPIIKSVLTNSGVPKLALPALMPSLRRKAIKSIQGQGIGRLSAADERAIATSLMEALAQHLEDRPFMLGDEPHGIDASAYGMLVGTQKLELPGALKDAFIAHPVLGRYCDAVGALAWSEGTSTLQN